MQPYIFQQIMLSISIAAFLGFLVLQTILFAEFGLFLSPFWAVIGNYLHHRTRGVSVARRLESQIICVPDYSGIVICVNSANFILGRARPIHNWIKRHLESR